MATTEILLLSSILVFTVYNAWITLRFGQQRSISDSWYRLTLKDNILFIASTWGYVIPLFFIVLLQPNVSDLVKIIFFFGTFLLVTVPVFPDFHLPSVKPWHSLGAEGGIALAMVCGVLLGMWWVPVPFIIFTWLMMKNAIRNHTYWIEIVAYYAVAFMLWFKFIYLPSLF